MPAKQWRELGGTDNVREPAGRPCVVLSCRPGLARDGSVIALATEPHSPTGVSLWWPQFDFQGVGPDDKASYHASDASPVLTNPGTSAARESNAFSCSLPAPASD